MGDEPAVEGAGPAGRGPQGRRISRLGIRGLVLAAVAIVCCVALLRQLGSGPDGVNLFSRVTSEPAPAPSLQVQTTTAAGFPGTTRPKGEVRVLVANGAGVKGLATAATNALRNVGYDVLPPVDATTIVATTLVQFSVGYEADARGIAAALTLGVRAVSALDAPPVDAGDIGDARVIVVLGADLDTGTPGASAGAVSTTATTRR
ncbi:MAG: LytR C-terminal domain-containing protein [Actinomycetota bacterium]|nr:LytR C-terminal domain-containing protein [Actinomycetota bacterium]